MNQSPADQQNRLEEASKGATDLSGLVRKKKPAPDPPVQAEQSEPKTSKKRSASEESGSGKRAKTEDPPTGS